MFYARSARRGGVQGNCCLYKDKKVKSFKEKVKRSFLHLVDDAFE